MSKCFWCTCPRCSDPTEFGSNFSSILDSGHPMLQSNPLDTESDWVCYKTGITKTAHDVKMLKTRVAQELKDLNKTSLPALTGFLSRHESQLGPANHSVVEVKYAVVRLLGNRPPYSLEQLSPSSCSSNSTWPSSWSAWQTSW